MTQYPEIDGRTRPPDPDRRRYAMGVQPKPPAADAGGRTRQSLTLARHAVTALFALTVALILGLVAAAIRTDYLHAYTEAETQTSTLVAAVEEHVKRTTLETDRVLRGLVEQIELRGGFAAFPPGTLHAALKRQAEESPQLESLFALDEEGNVAASGLSPTMGSVNLFDRDYFQHFQSGAGNELHVGKRIVSRVTGNVLFTLSRRISDRSDRFRGVLAAGVRADYFRQFYDRLNLPANSSILIARSDGFFLFRHPERQFRNQSDDISDLSLFTRYLPNGPIGSFEERSPFDQLDRIISYRSVQDLPIVAMLTIARDAALAGWRADATRKIAFTAGMLLLLTALTWLVRRQLLRVERAETALVVSQARFQDLATLASDGFWEQDAQHRFSWLGNSMDRLPVNLAGAFAGKQLWELPVRNMGDADWAHHRRVLEERRPFRDLSLKFSLNGAAVWLSLSGNPLFDRSGKFSGYHGISRDVTEEMETRAEMSRHALLDPLTRLPNRRLLLDRLDQTIASARRSGGRLAVAFIDLDGFKQVNDRFGHHVGDELLKAVAQRLAEDLRDTDTVARIGGDEFVVLFPGMGDPAAASAVATKMLGRLSRPYEIEGAPIKISGSFGLALYPEHGASGDALVRAADQAMYNVKAAGRNGVAMANALPGLAPGAS